MQATSNTARSRAVVPNGTAPAAAATIDANPPVITPAADLTLHPIYGKTPIGRDGFTLDRQNMHMLALWHRKAIDYIESLPANQANPLLQEAQQICGDIYEAILAYKPVSGGDVARQFEAICREAEHQETVTVFGVEEFRALVDGLREATKFPEATKRLGDLDRDGRLTRAGLLHRYHAFLVGELQTLSWNLYGNRDYAMCMVPIDDAVTERTSELFKDGKPKEYRSGRRYYPFFDESKLTSRAKTVLGSLMINTTKPGRR